MKPRFFWQTSWYSISWYQYHCGEDLCTPTIMVMCSPSNLLEWKSVYVQMQCLGWHYRNMYSLSATKNCIVTAVKAQAYVYEQNNVTNSNLECLYRLKFCMYYLISSYRKIYAVFNRIDFQIVDEHIRWRCSDVCVSSTIWITSALFCAYIISSYRHQFRDVA